MISQVEGTPMHLRCSFIVYYDCNQQTQQAFHAATEMWVLQWRCHRVATNTAEHTPWRDQEVCRCGSECRVTQSIQAVELPEWNRVEQALQRRPPIKCR